MKHQSLSPEWRSQVAIPTSTPRRQAPRPRIKRADLVGFVLLVALSIALLPLASRATNRQQLWITPSESQLR